MKKYGHFLLVTACLFFLMACQHKTQSGNDEQANFPEFLEQFRPLKVPYSLMADSVPSHLSDSLALGHKKYGRLIPDSIWHDGHKKAPAKIFPLGKIRLGTLYLLFVKIQKGASGNIMLWIYDKGDTLVTAQELFSTEKVAGNKKSFNLDKSNLLRISEKKNLADGEVVRSEKVYGIEKDGNLTLIMTNTNEPANPNSFYNPIDTLPAKERYSGNYNSGKSDVVAIRDGDKPGSFRFFIHLNKDKGNCTGEIDGMGKFEHSQVGIYKEDAGPCAIQFNFSKDKVTIKEVGGCGAYRGISCNFTGTYTRDKKSKPKSK